MLALAPLRNEYLSHVDGLRCIAVLAVLWTHFELPGLSGGFLGVDVFFVISGFLISRLIIEERRRTGGFSYRRFYLRRIRRLFPALLFTVAISLVLFYPILGPADLISFLRSVPFALTALANMNYFLEVGYFDGAAQSKPLLHIWSLAVEEQFYFLWPTLLLSAVALRRDLAALTLALLIASCAAAQQWTADHPNATYYLLPFRAFELLSGAFLATLTARNVPRRTYFLALPPAARSALATGGLMLIFGSYVLLDETSQLPGLGSLPLCLGTALVILFGDQGVCGRLLTSRPLVLTGVVSYSLYLLHWPVFVYISYRLPEAPETLMKLSMFPISFALAIFSYVFVEQSFRRPAPARAAWGNLPFLASAAALSVLLMAPAAAYKFMPSARFPERMPFGPPNDPKMMSVKAPYPNSPSQHTLFRIRSGLRDAPKLLIIGDSHAEQFLEAAEFYLSPAGLDVDIASITGCPGLMDLAISWAGDGYRDDCAAHIRAREAISLDPAYDAVMISSRWNVALNPADEGDTAFQSARYGLASGKGIIPSRTLDQSREFFIGALEKTVSRLEAAGKRVVLVSQVPSFGNDLTQCAALFPWAMSSHASDGRCFRLSADTVKRRAGFANEAMRAAADGHPGIMAIIPTDYMCGKTRCLLRDPENGEPFYRDSNHLDRAGAIWLMQQADQAQGLVRFITEEKLASGAH